MPVLEVSLLHVVNAQFGSFHSELQFVVADFVRDLSVLLCHHFPYCQEREVESAKKNSHAYIQTHKVLDSGLRIYIEL